MNYSLANQLVIGILQRHWINESGSPTHMCFHRTRKQTTNSRTGLADFCRTCYKRVDTVNNSMVVKVLTSRKIK